MIGGLPLAGQKGAATNLSSNTLGGKKPPDDLQGRFRSIREA